MLGSSLRERGLSAAAPACLYAPPACLPRTTQRCGRLSAASRFTIDQIRALMGASRLGLEGGSVAAGRPATGACARRRRADCRLARLLTAASCCLRCRVPVQHQEHECHCGEQPAAVGGASRAGGPLRRRGARRGAGNNSCSLLQHPPGPDNLIWHCGWAPMPPGLLRHACHPHTPAPGPPPPVQHVDHGKSTLTDSLVAAAGIIAMEQVRLRRLARYALVLLLVFAAPGGRP